MDVISYPNQSWLSSSLLIKRRSRICTTGTETTTCNDFYMWVYGQYFIAGVYVMRKWDVYLKYEYYSSNNLAVKVVLRVITHFIPSCSKLLKVRPSAIKVTVVMIKIFDTTWTHYSPPCWIQTCSTFVFFRARTSRTVNVISTKQGIRYNMM